MSYDKFLLSGLDGTEIWDTIKKKGVSHNTMLQEMRNYQEQLSLYSKTHAMDDVQTGMLRHIKFLETMAWRVYMFGYSNLYSVNPGQGGEYAKRMKLDGKFHRMLEQYKLRMGPPGCQYPQNLFWFNMKCAVRGCKHTGGKYAVKQLKQQMRQEWERDILSKYKY